MIKLILILIIIFLIIIIIICTKHQRIKKEGLTNMTMPYDIIIVKPHGVGKDFVGYFAHVNHFLYLIANSKGEGSLKFSPKYFTGIESKHNTTNFKNPLEINALAYSDDKLLEDRNQKWLFDNKYTFPSSDHRYPESYRNKEQITKRRKELNKAFNNNCRISKHILVITNSYNSRFNTNVLGIHIRSQKQSKLEHIPFEEFIKIYTDYVDSKLKEYSSIFLATHLQDAFDLFKNRYGNKLIVHNHYLNPNNKSDWTDNKIDREEENRNVLIDMILLSKCKEIVGGPSNVFYAAIWYNTSLNFYMPDIYKEEVL